MSLRHITYAPTDLVDAVSSGNGVASGRSNWASATARFGSEHSSGPGAGTADALTSDTNCSREDPAPTPDIKEYPVPPSQYDPTMRTDFDRAAEIARLATELD